MGFSVYSFTTLLGTILLTLINYTLTLLIIIILKFILHLDTIQNIIHNKTVTKMALLSTIVITVSYASLILMSRHEFNQLTYLKTTLLVSLMSTIFIVIGSIMLVMGYMKEVRSKYEIRHLKERNLYIEELERKNTELRRFKHDYKNLLTSLSVSLRSNNSNNDSIQRLLDYADSNVDMTSTVENANLYHLNDDLVKGIIITKLVAAKNKHIETNFEVDQSILIPKALSVEITRILGILFDNAIEASLLTNNPEISFALVVFDGYLEFIIKNNIASSEKINLDQIYQTGYTSKKDHNGLGLSTVNKIIHSNSNLLLQNKVKDGYFSTILTVLEDK
ncbi:sensor histidine kinase [Companilactobacillus bobalius]|uniref:sensor histidine kinase n=1 Tax=Companilactobacillus bobalius TaxID=2801451 RepID=UPI0013023E56|nr:GHKL domain-containing protein [Companilactobacillus bobalius]